MIAKVISEDNREYISHIFAKFSKGFDTTVITYDSDHNRFEYINMYDKTPYLKRKVFIFDSNNEGMIELKGLRVGFLKSFKSAFGYDWILSNDIIVNIIKNKDVDKKYSEIAANINSKIEVQEWYYVKNEKDADSLLELAFGFHDALIVDININNGSNYDDSSTVEVTFSGCWGCNVTLLFQGDILVHYLLDDECSNEIFDSSILFENEYIYWVDGSINNVTQLKDYHTYFRAKSLKWKFTLF